MVNSVYLEDQNILRSMLGVVPIFTQVRLFLTSQIILVSPPPTACLSVQGKSKEALLHDFAQQSYDWSRLQCQVNNDSSLGIPSDADKT